MIRIAVILSQMEESCQSRIWDGVAAAAARHGVELITFAAFSLDRDDAIRSHYEMFNSFISEDKFDGAILFTGAMSEYTPWPEVKRYADSIGIPLVTIAGSVRNSSNIVVNNHSGIIEQITHLVEVHNRRRIAFISGPESNEEATQRFYAYREALELNSIPFEPELVLPGDFSEEAGEAGAAALIQKGISFDALLGVDDYTAIGAMRELMRNDINVPHDVSLVGFDDIDEASMLTPALTTIQQPFYLQGSTALETVLVQLGADRQISTESIELNTHAVYRSSCGCTSEEVRLFRENWHIERALQGRDALADFIAKVEPLIAFQILEMHFHLEKGELYRAFIIEELKVLWDSFFDDIEIQKNNFTFLDTLLRILDRNSEFTDDILIWQCILSNLAPFAHHFDEKPEQLLAGAILHEARIALDSREKRQVQIRSYEKMSEDEHIRESCTKIITSKSQDELKDTLSKELIEHDFKNTLLVIFNRYTPVSHSDWNLPPHFFLQLQIIDGEVTLTDDQDEQGFLSDYLIPFHLREHFNGKNLLFFPLYMNSEYFGYFLTEVIPGAPKELYSEFQTHISSAYKSCYMLDNLRALSMNDELTGLSNRRGFMLLSHQLHAKAQNSSMDLLIFYFDMDNLKYINDTFSHEDGDKAIKATASLLRRTFRNHDIIGRMGGDEFVVIIEETVPGLEDIMVKRLRDLIVTYNQHSGLPYDVDLSVGTAAISFSEDRLLTDAIKQADQNMFINKRERKKGRQQ